MSGTRREGCAGGGRKRPTMGKVIGMEGKDTIIVRLPNPPSESRI